MTSELINIVVKQQEDIDDIIMSTSVEINKLRSEVKHWQLLFEQKSIKCNLLLSDTTISCIDLDIWHNSENKLKKIIASQKELLDSIEGDNIRLYESSTNSDRYSVKVNYLFKQSAIKYKIQFFLGIITYSTASIMLSTIFLLPLMFTIILFLIR